MSSGPAAAYLEVESAIFRSSFENGKFKSSTFKSNGENLISGNNLGILWFNTDKDNFNDLIF